LLQSYVMTALASIFDENPSVEGPDYVTLVIEWDELADDLERKLGAGAGIAAPKPEPDWGHVLKIAAGVLGAAVLLWRIVRQPRV
jgi:hypothetical protein